MSLNKKKYPLPVLKGFFQLQKDCKRKANENASILDYGYNPDGLYIRFTDKDPSSNFYFSIESPSLTNPSNGEILAVLKYIPKTETVLTEYIYSLEISQIGNALNRWIELVKSFNDLPTGQEDDFEKRYAEEYYTSYEMVDEDAYTMPFDIKKQKDFIVLLEFVEQRVLSAPSQDAKSKEIVDEINSLKNNIQNLTKNENLKWYAKIEAKIYMKGAKFTTYVWGAGKDEFKKYIIQKGIEWLTDGVGHAFQHLIGSI